jgi:arsenite/tail-anchored protein-transporting ATPase
MTSKDTQIPSQRPADSLGTFLQHPTRFLFFTGKGGVGKTSLACATALALADQGRRVLLVSTDPASNLDEVLGVTLGRAPTSIPGAPDGLSALNIDPEAAAAAHREKMVGPMRGVLPEAALRSMEEQLSGACTMEIAAFDEFTSWLGGDNGNSQFDHLVFDTAPTGHTLRLLALSKAWTGFLQNNTSGTSCLGPLAGLEKQREVYAATVRALGDNARTTVVLVARPQSATLAEAQRTHGELAALGIRNQVLVLNGVLPATESDDPVAEAMRKRGSRALAQHAAFVEALPVYSVALRPHNVLGFDALRGLYAEPSSEPVPNDSAAPIVFDGMSDMLALVERISAAGRGVVMTMGKGGVGKTTVAAALALALARRGHPVHLSTTDPAAHIASTLGTGVENLTISRIDPAAETRAYVEEVMTTRGRDMDHESRALLEEDLRSPCTEEIAVFRAFARTVARGENGFVVLDTAPTGHTLLLLDATQAYHRELGRQSRSDIPPAVANLLPRLRDPNFTRILLVTLPEATPVHEAAELERDLARAEIKPFGWVINQSLTEAGVSDPLLVARRNAEERYIREVLELHGPHVVLLPWAVEEPVGTDGLAELVEPGAHV